MDDLSHRAVRVNAADGVGMNGVGVSVEDKTYTGRRDGGGHEKESIVNIMLVCHLHKLCATLTLLC